MSADRATLLRLAERCEVEKPSRDLTNDIGRAIHEKGDEFARWNYCRDLDQASKISGWALLHASDISADGLPHVVLTDGTTEAKGIGGRNLTMTWCAAALRARAHEAKS